MCCRPRIGGGEGGADPRILAGRYAPRKLDKGSLPFSRLTLHQEGVRLPRGFVRLQHQIGQGEGIVERRTAHLQLSFKVGILELNHPNHPLSFDREPPRLTRFPVVILRDATVRDQVVQVREQRTFNRRRVNVTTFLRLDVPQCPPLHDQVPRRSLPDSGLEGATLPHFGSMPSGVAVIGKPYPEIKVNQPMLRISA